MAFDQNLIPKDLRPLNIVRTMADDAHIAPVTTSGRTIEGFYANPPRDGSPGSVPAVYYPAAVSDAGFVGLGFSNGMAVPGVAGWVPHVATPLPPQPGVMSAGLVNSGSGFSHTPSFGPRSHASDQASVEGGDGSVSGRKVKFLCSFGGKILPRPSDGALRYVGGQTRIISVRRDVSFTELVQKMVDIYGESVVIKYQLPEEDLDALVSVSGPDDLENMMDEYEKLIERSPDGSAKLRVFLFSASEVESAGMVQFSDLRDNGQKYFEAVNGILDGVGIGRITRKESTASAASTQNSEFSGADAGDNLGHGQGEANGPPSTGALSPRENSTPSQQATPRTAYVDPSVHVDASTAPLGLPVVISGPPPAMPVQPEHEVERSAPVVVPQQIGLNIQQGGVAFPTSSPYMQVYVDPHHEILNRGEYVQHPSQMGFPTQVLGSVAPVLPQQHVAAGVTPQQFIPAVHMTMPPSSHVSINPNMVPALIQHQQIRLEQIPAESTMAQRVVQLPFNSTYNAYQAQVPPAVIGGAYAWHQVPQQEQVTYSEGWVPNKQVVVPEQNSRFEDCIMCQKALPHAHSDSIAQEQKESLASNSSDHKLVHYSLQLDDKGRPMNRTVVYGAQGEGMVEQQGTAAQLRGHVEPEVGKTQVETIGFPQKVEGQYSGDRFVLQKGENSEQPKVSVPQGAIGLTGGIQSPCGVPVGTVPQSYQDNAVQQVVVPMQYQIRRESMLIRPTYGDSPTVGGMPLQTSGYRLHESPKDYSGNISPMVPKEDNSESSAVYDHLRQIDGRMEHLRINPAEVLPYNGQSKSPIDNLKREDILENRQPKVGEREAYLDANFSNPHTILDANQTKQNEMLPCFGNESPYLHNLRPIEPYDVAQPPLFGNPTLHPHPMQGINHMVYDDIYSGIPAFSGVDTAHPTERFPPFGERQDNGPSFESKIVPTDVGGVLLDGNTTSSQSPSYGVGEVQDNSNSLFSNQDPWNFRQDGHFPPPKPKQIQLKKEALSSRDPSGDRHLTSSGELLVSNGGAFMTEARLEAVHQTSGNLNADSNSEHTQSNKGSAEELIKQELQAVAEGVAASVLRTSVHSNPDLSAHGKSETLTMSQENNEVQKTDVEVEPKDHFEEIKAKFPEKLNFGFPLSDGIGRLQIIKNSDLEELRELGSGTFGTVYHGKWRGSDVAIKRINDRCFAGKPSEQERMIDDFWNEAIKLADLHHPNVVAFYGVVLDGPGGSVATVTEYMVNGSLRTALQKNEKNLDKRKRVMIAMDVAFGMEYLHGKKIVHFDLKSDNLLVNLRDPQRPICKVGDLGLSKVKCHTLISGGVRGTLPWMAPELLNGSSSLVSEKVDVYSFGIVLWELLTGEEPYADLHYGAIIGGIVSNTLRPPIPESCDPEWRSLMERCWSSEPSERLSFTEIANELRAMSSKHLAKGQMQQSHPSAHPHAKS